MHKISTYYLRSYRSDPQSSVGAMTPLKQVEHPEVWTGDSGTRVFAWGSKILRHISNVDDNIEIICYSL